MALTEQTSNFPDWKNLPGQTLDGGYELKELIEAEEDRATFRVRVLGDYSLKASARFYALKESAADEQIGLWQAIRGFADKTNLSVPLGTGTLSMNGVKVLYLVSQNSDETLGDVLSQRALKAPEATEVLRAVARGLSELHSNGVVHGCVSPKEVLAIGDSIKLSTESIRRIHADPIIERGAAEYLAPESGAQNLTIAADVWCLGATLSEALTQKIYEPGRRDEVGALPHPFGTLLTCCLDPDPDQRCKLSDLERILTSKALPPKTRQEPVTVREPVRIVGPEPASAVAKSRPSPEPEAAQMNLQATAAAAGVESVKPAAVVTELPKQPAAVRKSANELFSTRQVSRTDVAAEEKENSGALSGRRGWIYAAAAFILIFLALWFVRSRPRGGETGTQAAARETTSATPAQTPTDSSKPGAAWPTKTLTPESKTPAATHAEVRSRPTAAQPALSSGQGRTVWRVVLFTYGRQADAEKKAQSVNGKHAGLQAEVFSPSGTGGPYLVVAGGRMAREDAARLRLRAIREGMPRDSYIQNYSR